MSSSTSSSEALAAETAVATPRRIRWVALVLILGLLGLEVVTRLKLFHLSKDFVIFATYPQRAAALGRRDGTRVAVVGNSITHEDVDPVALADRLQALGGGRFSADLFYADHSFVNTWQFLLQRYFWHPRNPVDLVVIPFWGTNLYDGNELEVGRLAQFFTTTEDWPTVLSLDLATISERADFLVSSAWATFAARDRMREWAFTSALPHYKEYVSKEQDVLTNHLVRATAGKPKRPRTTAALARLLASARAHGTRLVFVAFPTLHEEWNDRYEEAVRMIEAAGMHYLDLRETDVVNDQSYVDLVHMNADGRAAFTRRLAESLLPFVRCEGPACGVQSAAADQGRDEGRALE